MSVTTDHQADALDDIFEPEEPHAWSLFRIDVPKLSEEEQRQKLRDLREARRQWQARRACNLSKRSASDAKYNSSAKGRARQQRYNDSEKGKARRQRYEESPRGVGMRFAYEFHDRYLVNLRWRVAGYFRQRFEWTGDPQDLNPEPLRDCRDEEHHIRRWATAIRAEREEAAHQAELAEIRWLRESMRASAEQSSAALDPVRRTVAAPES